MTSQSLAIRSKINAIFHILSYFCRLLASGAILIENLNSPCYAEFLAPTFIEFFNLRAAPTPDNFVYLDNRQIPFLPQVEFAAWQSLKFQNADAPGTRINKKFLGFHYLKRILNYYLDLENE